jgi:DNA repair protein RAD57
MFLIVTKPPEDDTTRQQGGQGHTQSQHPSSSQSLNLTHDQAWYAAGPDPPLLYTTQGRWFSGQGSSGKKEAALGVVWANTVNTRIMLSRTGRRRVLKPDEAGYIEEEIMSTRPGGNGSPGGEEGEQKTLIRRAHLVFSPFAPPGTVDFVIRPSGISGLKGTYALDEDGAKVLARARKREKAVAGLDEGEEEENGEGGGDIEEDLFGPLNGLDDVPEEWWNGIVDGEMLGEEPGQGGGEAGVGVNQS